MWLGARSALAKAVVVLFQSPKTLPIQRWACGPRGWSLFATENLEITWRGTRNTASECNFEGLGDPKFLGFWSCNIWSLSQLLAKCAGSLVEHGANMLLPWPWCRLIDFTFLFAKGNAAVPQSFSPFYSSCNLAVHDMFRGTPHILLQSSSIFNRCNISCYLLLSRILSRKSMLCSFFGLIIGSSQHWKQHGTASLALPRGKAFLVDLIIALTDFHLGNVSHKDPHASAYETVPQLQLPGRLGLSMTLLTVVLCKVYTRPYPAFWSSI